MPMTAARLRHDDPAPASPPRRVFALVQTEPHFAVLATADDHGRLEVERQAMLDLPWDQHAGGSRALRIVSAIHLGSPA